MAICFFSCFVCDLGLIERCSSCDDIDFIRLYKNSFYSIYMEKSLNISGCFFRKIHKQTLDIVDIKISNNGIFFLLTTNVLLLRKAWKHVSDAHILFCYVFLFAKSFLRMLNEVISKIKTNLTSTKSLLYLAVWCLCF